MQPILNNTKWEELRLEMYDLGDLAPRWRAKDLSGHISNWDGDWFYHFRSGGYASIEWAEIEVLSPAQDLAVLKALRRIHLPGHRTEVGFRIYGHVQDGSAMGYVER